MPMLTRDVVEDSANYLENARAHLEELLFPNCKEVGKEHEVILYYSQCLGSLFLHSLHFIKARR